MKAVRGKIAIFVTTALVAGLTASCGSKVQTSPLSSGVSGGPAPAPAAGPPGTNISSQPLVFSAPAPGQLPYPTVNGLAPSTLNALLGIYDCVLIKDLSDGASNTQAATLQLMQAYVQGQPNDTYAFVAFDSPSGPIGTVRFNNFLSLGVNGQSPYFGSYNLLTYGLISPAMSIQELSSSPIGVSMLLTLTNGTQFDPTQSSIYFKDCGLSQGVCLGNLSSNVRLSELRKR